jgi:hypothetical protein
VRDLVQVRSCVRAAARLDDGGQFVARLQRPEPLTTTDEEAVLQEEGWILLLTGAS